MKESSALHCVLATLPAEEGRYVRRANTRQFWTWMFHWASSDNDNNQAYDPTIGRFVQADTVVPDGVQGYDRYAYANNNPVLYNDPTGHIGCFGKNADDGPQCYQKGKINNLGHNQPMGKRAKYHQVTLTDKVLNGDMSALGQLVLPSHIGGRLQLEGSVDIGLGLSGSIGVNAAYNRYSDRLTANVDWSVTVGGGIGGGVSGTGGVLLGWGSTTTDDVTKGSSAILSGTAAAGPAASVAVSAPMDQTGALHVDAYTGQIPVTVYGGGGSGGGYAGVGGGGSFQTGIYGDLTKYLPWHWFK